MSNWSEKQDYTVDGNTFEAHVAYPDKGSDRKACVLVCHAWFGRTEFEDGIADKIAKDYKDGALIGIAIDCYGKGVRGTGPENNRALMAPLLADRAMLLKRLQAGYDLAVKNPRVDPTKIIAMGFCFGGLCVLDMARANMNLLGVVPIHGVFNKPEPAFGTADINTKVLVLHGYDDSMVTPDLMVGLCNELSQRNADWQLVAFGDVGHAFTNPQANDKKTKTMYSEKATHRSWRYIKCFVDELLN